MKNIFQISSNKLWSGIEQYIYDLSSDLKKDGNYVEIVCRKYEPVLNRFRQIELPISILPLKGFTDLDSPVRFARLVKNNKNIIHVHNFKDAATAIMARHISENPDTRVVLTRHIVKRAKSGMIYRKLYKEIDKIIFVSELAKEEFLLSHPRIDRAKLVVVHNSVKPSTPSLVPAPVLRDKYAIDPAKKVLMFHGRLCREKGIETLLKAITQLDKQTYHLFVIGEGEQSYVSRLKAFIVANQLIANTTLLGFVEDVQPLIAQADIGILPSIWKEPFGLANLEYMMAGKPHICTSNGAQREYVRDGISGVLVPPDNFHILADAVKNLIENDTLCKQIGTQAREQFDLELAYPIFSQRINKIYDDLLK